MNFYSDFLNYRAFEMLYPLTDMWFLRFQQRITFLFFKKGTVCGYRMQYVVKISPGYSSGFVAKFI